jgi:hypothetical protein
MSSLVGRCALAADPKHQHRASLAVDAFLGGAPSRSASESADSSIVALPLVTAAFFRISLNHRELAISEVFDGFDLAIKVVVMKFADQNSARVFLDEINLPVKVPVALDPDELAVFCTF